MRSRGADRPDGDADQRNEQPGKSRRLFGRGRPEPVEPAEVPREETGWLDDLRTAKEDRSAIGPGKPTDGKSSKSGKTAPAPDDVPDDTPSFLTADAEPGPARRPGPGRRRGRVRPHRRPAGAKRVARPRRLSAVPRHRLWQARGRVARSPDADAAPAPYAAGPPPGQFGPAGRPVSPPSSAPASGGGAGGARARFQDADGTWHSGSGEYPSGSWRTVPGDGGPGRHTSPLNPDGTDEAGPGRGRRTIDPGQFGGPSTADGPPRAAHCPAGRSPAVPPPAGRRGPVSAVPMSGNAPAVPTPRLPPNRAVAPVRRRRRTSPAGPTAPAHRSSPGRAGRPAAPAADGTPPASSPRSRPATTPVRRAVRPVGAPPRTRTIPRSSTAVAAGPATPRDAARREPGPADGPGRRLSGTAPRRRRSAGVGRAGTRRNVLRLPQHRHHRTGATGRCLDAGHRPASGARPGVTHRPGIGEPGVRKPRPPARAPALIHLASTPGPSRRARAVVRSPLVLFRPAEHGGPVSAGQHAGPVSPGPRGGPISAGPVSPGQHGGPVSAGQHAGSVPPGQHTGPVGRGQRPGPDGASGGPAGAQHTGPIGRGQRPGPDGLPPPGAVAAGQHTGPLARGQRPDPDGPNAGPVPGGPGPRGQAGQRPGPGNATGRRAGSDIAGEPQQRVARRRRRKPAAGSARPSRRRPPRWTGRRGRHGCGRHGPRHARRGPIRSRHRSRGPAGGPRPRGRPHARRAGPRGSDGGQCFRRYPASR